MATRSTSPRWTACWWRSTPRPARRSGRPSVEDWSNGYYMTLAPLVAKGKVMVGVSGGEFGMRGFVAAFDAETGKEAWKTYTVPGPGEPGHETWQGRAWKTGGGPSGSPGNYDPQDRPGLLGHRQRRRPGCRRPRPGDNLYTTSVDRDRRRYRQDQGPSPVPLERRLGLGRGLGPDPGRHRARGQDRSRPWSMPAATAISGRSSARRRQDRLHRRPGPSSTRTSSPASTPRPAGRATIRAKKPGTGKALTFCPGLWGGKDWPPEAYNPKTGCSTSPPTTTCAPSCRRRAESTYVPGRALHRLSDRRDPDQPRFREGSIRRPTIGELQAWDLKTGKKVWTHKFPTAPTGGRC